MWWWHNPSTQEAEQGGSLLSSRPVGLHSEFQDSKGYIHSEAILKKKKKTSIVGVKSSEKCYPIAHLGCVPEVADGGPTHLNLM